MTLSNLSSVRVHLLSQQHLEAMALVQQVEDVGHLSVPADTCQETYLHRGQAAVRKAG